MTILQTIPLTTPDPPVTAYPQLLVPQALHLRLAAKCNLACDYCERENWKNGAKATEKDMPLAVWQALKERFLEPVAGVELAGLGEPTLSRIFPQVCRDIVAADKTLYFPTNGYFLDKPHVLEAVGDTPRVSISLDAWDADSYRLVRGGDWDRVRRAVKHFHKEKPRAFLHSQYTASIKNIDGLPLFLQVAADWGIQEVIMRFVQCHTPGTAREDVSLRFAKDRTEAAIEAAREVAEREGIWFTAERRDYSASDPNSLGEGKVDPLSRLRRYLDIVPFSNPTCGFSGGGTVTTNCLTPQTLVMTQDNRLVPAGNLRPGDWLKARTKEGVVVPEQVACAVLASAPLLKVQAGKYAFTASPSHEVMLYDAKVKGGVKIPVSRLYAGDTLILANGAPVTVTGIEWLKTEGAVVNLALAGPHHTYLAAGVWHHNKASGIGGLHAWLPGDNQPIIIRTPRVPRQKQAALPPGALPLAPTPAALIVAHDGDLWTCFAGHSVGNAFTDDMAGVVGNPMYQRFLQNRHASLEAILKDPLCKNCPRAF